MFYAPRHRTYKHQKWARAVKKKFNGKCALTGSTKRGQAHHIFSADDYPDLMDDINNGIFIAAWVHKLYHIEFMGGYDVPADQKSWDKFVSLFQTIKKKL